jgi:hypothetical protein
VNQGDVRRSLRRERPYHLGIELDCRQMINARRQAQRQCPGTRTDLDKPIGRRRSDRLDQLVSPGRFEKVLTVSLLRAWVHAKINNRSEQAGERATRPARLRQGSGEVSPQRFARRRKPLG